MQRRDFCRFLVTGLCAAGSNDLVAHTPYAQWTIYRRKHLLIGCHKDDDETYSLAKSIVVTLNQHLPDARARVARAPTAQRLASLLGTRQLDVALLSPDNARQMNAGEGPFIPYGEIDLGVVQLLQGYLLICRNDFPARHAWLLAQALQDSSDARPVERESSSQLPYHQGAVQFHAGLPLPDKP